MPHSFTADVVETETTLTLRNTAWQSVAASVSGSFQPVAVSFSFLSHATLPLLFLVNIFVFVFLLKKDFGNGPITNHISVSFPSCPHLCRMCLAISASVSLAFYLFRHDN